MYIRNAIRLFLATLLLSIPFHALSGQAGTEGPRVALVIGNGNYQYNTTLKNPAADAADIAAALTRNGFTVKLLTNATRAQMETAIRDFGSQLKNPLTVGLFYYSGHGAQAEGQNYIMPVMVAALMPP